MRGALPMSSRRVASRAAGNWVAPKRGFLFPVKALSQVFLGKFIARLGASPHGLDTRGWERLRARLYAHPWVVYAKAPLAGPGQVLDYLARYTHRVAISNERIVAVTDKEVLVRVRVRKGQGEYKRPIVRIPGTEFIGRFLTHVLPGGFKRIRHYGLLAPAHKRARLAAARAALDVPPPDPLVLESVADFLKRIDRLQALRCPHCGGSFVVVCALAPHGPPHPARAPP